MGKPASGLLAAAKAGNVDKIFELAYEAGGGDDGDYGDNSEADDVAYFWLLIAADFGHKKADSAITDMHETSSFRYDDDQGARGLAHLDLAEAYLQGTEGLSVDLEKAKAHLETAKEVGVHLSVDLGKHFRLIRKKLKPAALEVYDAVFPDKKSAAKKSAAKKSAAKKPAAKKPAAPAKPKRPV